MNAQDTVDTFIIAGFQPPKSYYVKVDPRGSEYGSFHVTYNTTDYLIQVDSITVNKVKDGKYIYTMHFLTQTDFLNWAKDCT